MKISNKRENFHEAFKITGTQRLDLRYCQIRPIRTGHLTRVQVLPHVTRVETDELAYDWHVRVRLQLDLAGDLVVEVSESFVGQALVETHQMEEVDFGVGCARERLAIEMTFGVRVGPEKVRRDRVDG